MDNYIKKIKNKNIHIVGVSGTEGSAVLEFMAKNKIKNITAHDFSSDKEELRQNFSKTHLMIRKKDERFAEFEKILKMPKALNFKNKYLEGIMEADIIFAPSSWYLYKPNFPALKNAVEKGIEIGSITKLYFGLAKGKIISVTGTKGKGTTSKLIYEILSKSADKNNIYLAGNDRRAGQELEKISKMKKQDVLVLETSNRQLMADLGRSPDIGVITNISPDHIDEHGSFEKYIETKESLFRYSKKADMAVLNYDNEITKKFGEELFKRGVKVFFFSRKKEIENGAFVENGKIYILGNGVSKLICDLADIRLLGEHNLENILAASLAGYLAGASPENIRKAVRNFKGLPHRIEFIGEYNGVKFYDDVASTNPDSTIAAIEALNNHKPFAISRLLLVVGGDNKGMDYAGLAKEINDKIDVLILLPGTGSEKVKSEKLKVKSGDEKKKVFECNDFLEAMEIIKEQTKTGDIVLISPAAAYFQAKYIDVFGKPMRNLIVEKFS